MPWFGRYAKFTGKAFAHDANRLFVMAVNRDALHQIRKAVRPAVNCSWIVPSRITVYPWNYFRLQSVNFHSHASRCFQMFPLMEPGWGANSAWTAK
jgi:hypothetical protein